MKISIGIISLSCFLLLSSCASVQPAEVDSKLSAWQGAKIETIIQTWGLPTSERMINGVQYAEWNSREIKNNPSVNIGIGGFGSHLFGSIGTTIFGGQSESFCTVQVGYNEQGIVTHINWNGDAQACDAAVPERR